MSVKFQDCETCRNVDFCKYTKNAKSVKKSLVDVSKLLEAEPFNFSMTCKHHQTNVTVRTPLKGE